MLNPDDKISAAAPNTGPETPNQKAAKIIATQLTSSMAITDESGKPVQVQAFRTTGMPPQMAEEVAKTAVVLGEALVNAITVDYTLVPNGDLEQLRGQAAIGAGITPPVVTVDCPHGRPIFAVTTGKDRMRLNGAQMKAITGSEECSHG